MTELYVGLKVPDNVAITASLALKRMGYHEVEKLERKEYYNFKHSSDEKKFQDKIKNVDIIVNANKHHPTFELKQKKNTVHVLVQEQEKSKELLKTLKESLGFSEISKADKGVVWSITFSEGTNTTEVAEKITKELFMNEHYQECKIL